MSYRWPKIVPDDAEVRPIRDEVFIKIEEKGEKPTAGGIYISNATSHFSPSDRGVVMAVGPGRLLDTGEKYMPLAPGDFVFFDWKKGDDFQYRGEHYLMLKLEHIYGSLEIEEV